MSVELGEPGGVGSSPPLPLPPTATATAVHTRRLARLNFRPDRILMRKDKRARKDAFFLSGLFRPFNYRHRAENDELLQRRLDASASEG